ncbi:MAG TPA: hypothetical protein H9743_09675 [Candidatus Mediterraneibacter vanvlietii]|nr:hypothetical protein [Candidatus Mediterraneibacter vanvlietii]
MRGTSERAMKEKDNADGRVTVPISDEAAHITYYLACLKGEERYYGIQSLLLRQISR